MSLFLRRFADAMESGPNRRGRRRSVLDAAAADFLRQLRAKSGQQGGSGYSGRDLSRLAEPAFWSMLLVSAPRERFAMTLLSQEHKDRAAVKPYVQEKRAALEVLDAIPGIDADSLIGFVDVAIDQFLPPGTRGDPLVPRDAALAILRAALLRGAIVGDLRAEHVQEAWTASQGAAASDPERSYRLAQRKAETLLAEWRKARGAKRRTL